MCSLALALYSCFFSIIDGLGPYRYGYLLGKFSQSVRIQEKLDFSSFSYSLDFGRQTCGQ